MLISQTDLIAIAFNRGIDADRIMDSDINVAQWKYIRPALTDDLYTDLINNLSDYDGLMEYVKPALAYYVKFISFEELAFEFSNRGVFQLTSQDANGVTDTQRAKYKESILIKANELMSVAINYCVQQDLEEYNRSDALAPRIVGGFLVERLTGEVVNTDPDNPSTANYSKSFGTFDDTIYLQEKIAGFGLIQEHHGTSNNNHINTNFICRLFTNLLNERQPFR